MELFLWIEIISLSVFFCCVICFAVLLLFAKRGERKAFRLVPSEKKTKFAILIPARNESRVIEANLRSIYDADYPKENLDVYVIVESESDPTVKICEDYAGTEVFVRRDLTKRMKGYALDECIKDILECGREYDAFMILDADNLISRDFLARMSDAYAAGYDAACGKRDNKDWNASVVSSSSALTFTVINTLQNKPKTERGMNVMFSGTGFFVSYKVLKELGGWPFASLTEDYEFSNFALYNGLKTCYVESAVYYDEQPLTLGQSIIQRTRWVRGFFHVKRAYHKSKRKYSKERPESRDMRAMRFGTVPALVLAFDIIGYMLAVITGIIVSGITHNGRASMYFGRLAFVFASVYIVIALFTVILFRIEAEHINITEKNKIKTIFYHPFFLATYVISAVRSFFVKDTWEVIEHSQNKEQNDL